MEHMINKPKKEKAMNDMSAFPILGLFRSLYEINEDFCPIVTDQTDRDA